MAYRARLSAYRVAKTVESIVSAHRAGSEPPIVLCTRKPPRKQYTAAGGETLAQAAKRESQMQAMLAALGEVQANARAKFDETVDVAIHLNTDAKRTDLRTRGVVSLPHGLGKSVKVAVFTQDPVQADAARAAGADLVGAEELIQAVKDGKIEFARALATPDAMPLLAQVARILGPKGLMPNPKRGTVLADIAPAVQEAKAGQFEFKAEKAGVVHGPVGRLSFGTHKLRENLDAFIRAVLAKRPDQFKGKPPKGVSISSTMGKSVRIDSALF
ncbi:hypothetical protein KFE25_005940 [Diacronema lutheri]|uniref:Ribosomal protein n=1 Tax=Diacronema lutheri TaxID=2081491 RepID=A0A8J5XWZ2_DIALT|nr:hypothetical protein KFE25_005940 [Diacronema lutheri]